MNTELTPEQLRKIDSAVMATIGVERLTIGYYGTESETPRQAELEGWINQVGIRFIGDYYIDIARNWWRPVDEWRPTENHNAWATVEKFMGATFGLDEQWEYLCEMADIVDNTGYTDFAIATAPLPLRCLAFLRAMGVDTAAILNGDK